MFNKNHIIKQPLIKITVILILSVLFMGCSTFKKPVNDSNSVALTSENLNQLNGSYKRYSIENLDEIKSDSIQNSYETKDDLFSLLFLFYKNEEGQYDTVKLDVINSHLIQVSLLRNYTPTKSKKMRGRIRENTFEFNRRNVILPLVLFNVYGDQKTRLFILPNGNIKVDTKRTYYSVMMYFPFLAWDCEEKSNIEFEKIIN